MKTPARLCSRNSLTLILSMLFILLLTNPGAGQTAGEQIGGRYKFYGDKIVHRIKVPMNPPVAVILVQYLPPGTVIADAKPYYSSYDPEQGIAKWLFTEVSPGSLKVRVTLEREVPRDQVRAEVLFKDGSGASETLSITPMPLKRSAIEGC